MWNNLFFNELDKKKIIKAINKIITDKNLVLVSLTNQVKKNIFDVLNKNAKTKIINMNCDENKKYFSINYLKENSNKFWNIKIHFEFNNMQNFFNEIYSKNSLDEINPNIVQNEMSKEDIKETEISV